MRNDERFKPESPPSIAKPSGTGKLEQYCVHNKEGNEITLIDVIGNESESVVDEVELKMQVKRLYNKMKLVLKNREKMVLELRYGLLNGTSRTQREIAKLLGISRSYVSRIEKKAIKKLSRELKPESCH